ncbi:MAG: hypothetical protein V1792_09535 [Pseudomonadota bacterium]
MKNLSITLLALILVLGTGCLSFAFETDFDDLRRFDRTLPAWKLGRGVVNVLSAPYEVIATMTNTSADGGAYGAYDGGLQGYLAGSTNGLIAGSIDGTYRAAKRLTTGLLEIVTFWKPEYGPTLDPVWGTRNRADGSFFEAEPFWYVGPTRF